VRPDILMYASDYPHWDSDWPHTVKTVAERTDMTDDLKRKVMAENALRFYGLKAAVPA
jgi:predicted TIM-barrel fold metal-dependent hydrolase